MKKHFSAFLFFLSLPVTILLVPLTGGIACSRDLQIIVPYVGMGQAVILEVHGHGILIDTGPPGQIQHLKRRLQAYDVHGLDYLFLTHLHPDHAGGYAEFRQLWPRTPIVSSAHFPKHLDPVDRDFVPDVMDALSHDPRHRLVHAGDTIFWQGNQLHVLWPDIPSGSNLNKMSLVLLVRTATGKNILIMGDVDREIEHKLIPVLRQLLHNQTVDILVVGHHGAADSTDPELIRVAHPQVAIISVGRNNVLGYPAKKVLRKLKKHCGTVLRTDQDGELCFQLSAAGPVVCGSPLKNPGITQIK